MPLRRVEADQDRKRVSSLGTDLVLGSMTERDLVEYVNESWREASDRIKPFMAIQDTLWMLYRNKEDFSDKEDWQSHLSLPKAWTVVKQAAANLRKLLMQGDTWIRIKGYGLEEMLAPFIQGALNTLFKSHEFEFEDAFEHYIESALSCSLGVGKIVPTKFSTQAIDFYGNDPKSRRTQVGIKARAVDWRKFRYGPYTNPNKIDWCAEESTMPLALLQEEGTFNNLDKVKMESFEYPQEEVKERERFDFASSWMRTNLRLNQVAVREYYGDVIDHAKNEVVARNQYIVVLNKKYLGKIQKNRWPWAPYFLGSPLNVAFRFPGEGILEASNELFRTATRLANAEVDSRFFAVFPQFESDLSLLENPMDVTTGIEPGKFYRKKQGTNNIPAIRQIQITPTPESTLSLSVDREIQRGTFINDILAGLAPQRKEAVGTTQIETMAGSTMMMDMAERVERHGLDRAAEIAFVMAMMYLDESTRPNWSLLLGKPNLLDKVSAAQRKKILGENYNFEFMGLSETIRRHDRAQKIMQALQLIGSNEIFTAMVDLPAMFTDLMQAIDSGPYINPKAREIYQQMVKAMAERQEMAQKGKTEQMKEQFEARNKSAMDRDLFKHSLAKDMREFEAGLEAGKQTAGGAS